MKGEIKMVFVLAAVTVFLFITVDYFLRKEDKVIKETEKSKKSPIFLSPEKSLMPLDNSNDRLYHLSHSWALPIDDTFVYIGFDKFVASLFSDEVKIDNLPLIGTQIPQGTKIWDVRLNGHRISQLAPVSGEVVDINPACKVEIPLQSKDVERSWILKLKSRNIKNEVNNLMKTTQAKVINDALIDDLIINAQQGQYLNDGGEIDPNYVSKMTEDEWADFIKKYFPYQDNL